MMEPPPPRTISGTACLHMSIWLRRFTSIVRSQTSSERSVTAVSRVEEVRIGQRGVVVEHVETAEARHGRRDRGDHIVLLGQVGPKGQRTAPRALDVGRHPLGGRLVDVDDEDRGALPRQRARRGSADATAAAGDDVRPCRSDAP